MMVGNLKLSYRGGSRHRWKAMADWELGKMGRPRKLPDADELHQLRVVQKLTYREIADRYGVSIEAVRLALKKSGLTIPRARWSEELPWRIAVQHDTRKEAVYLRIAARLRHGKDVPEHKRRRAQIWMDDLAKPREGAPLGVVVDYDKDFYDGGFAYVPRMPGDDWIVRRPPQGDGSTQERSFSAN